MNRSEFIIIIFLGVSFCFGIDAQAQETKQPDIRHQTSDIRHQTPEDISKSKNLVREENEYNVNFVELIAKTIFSLIIITGLIYLVLRFFLKSQRWLIKPQDFIQTIATHPLSPNKYIQLIEIGNKLLVLGISEHNINLLTEIIDKEVIDAIKIQVSRQEDKMQLSFIQHLKNKLHGQVIKPTSYEEKITFLNKQRERLKKLEIET